MSSTTAPSRAITGLPVLSQLFSSCLPLLLFAPVFIQLSGFVFRDPATLLEPGAGFSRLPIPLALPAVYLALLAFRVEQRRLFSWRFVLMAPAVLLLTSLIAAGGMIPGDKLKLLFYFLLPIPALLAGEAFAQVRSLPALARPVVWILAGLLPTQLALTWWVHHRVVLSPDALLFMVYQHQQYVPVILTAGYLFALFTLWSSEGTEPDTSSEPAHRRALVVLGPVLGCYAAASMSMSAMIGVAVGTLIFAAHARWVSSDRRAAIVPVLATLSLLAYFVYGLSVSSAFQAKFLPGYERPARVHDIRDGPPSPVQGVSPLPLHVAERVAYWRMFSSASLSSAGGLLWGHSAQIDPQVATSAHNYYLDLVYNFGLIALLPLAWLMLRTAGLVRQRWYDILRSPPFLGLAGVMLFLMTMDNGMRVSLRIPYNGVVTYFLWGVLLAHLAGTAVPTHATGRRAG